MAHRFGSAEWAEALRRQLEGSSEYRQAAARWGEDFDGSMLLVFEADSARPRAERLLLQLARGGCTSAAFLREGEAPAVGFVLRAPFTLWRQILERKTLAATAILTGKMQVEGDRLKLLRHTAAHRALIHCTASVDTVWD
jgi:putative sterol carrier protein